MHCADVSNADFEQIKSRLGSYLAILIIYDDTPGLNCNGLSWMQVILSWGENRAAFTKREAIVGKFVLVFRE